MYTYKVIWCEETVDDDTSEITRSDHILPVIKKIDSTDEKFKVVNITFGPVPDFEYYERAVLYVLDENNEKIFKNSFDVNDNGSVEIYEPTGPYIEKISLEECELVENELNCEIYWDIYWDMG